MRRSETSLSNILGEVFGPYELVRRLGVGGMAETFVAVRRGPSGFTQRVCLKLVLPFFRDNEDFIALFEREARLAAKLRHRNIVGVIDFGEMEGTPYMALELVRGLDLRKLLDAQPDGKLPHEFVTMIALEMADALEHAHNPPVDAGIEHTEDDISGIVHRDISPSNVLISLHGEVLLTDFGVAKAISGTSRKQSAVKGKIPYMSPEQLRAESLDGRSDLFSLGVVLFEALTGQRPYEGAHDPATIMLILKGEHPSLSELAPDVPPTLCAAVERLLNPDRDQRPATATEFIEELDDFAPSPRVRRKLGSLVSRLRDHTGKQETEDTDGGGGLAESDRPVAPGTELLPDDVSPKTGSRISQDLSAAAQSATEPPKPTKPPVDPQAGFDSHRPEPWYSTPVPPNAQAQPYPHAPSAPPAPSSVPPGHEAPEQPLPLTPAPPAVKPASSAPPGVRPTPTPSHGLKGSDPADLIRPPKRDRPRIEREQAVRMARRDLELGATPRPRVSAFDDEPPRRKTSLGLYVFAALLFVGVVAGGVIAFWPTDDEPVVRQPKQADDAPVVRQDSIDPETPKTDLDRQPEPRQEEPRLDPVEPPPKKPATPEVVDRDQTPPIRQVAKDPVAKPRVTSRPAKPKVAKPGSLTVTVFPWGKIWINGQPWGRAPLNGESMPPGKYTIGVGQSGPSQTQVIRLKPGQQKTVHFDLQN